MKKEWPIIKNIEKRENLKIERFSVSEVVAADILKTVNLPREAQSKTVEKLVDNTPNWLELSEEEQLEAIQTRLTLDTIAQALYSLGYIKEGSDMYEAYVKESGTIHIDVYYIKNTEATRAIEKQFKKKQEEKRTTPIVSLENYRKKKGE